MACKGYWRTVVETRCSVVFDERKPAATRLGVRSTAPPVRHDTSFSAVMSALYRNVGNFARIRQAPCPAGGSQPRSEIVENLQDFLYAERAAGRIGPEPVVGDSLAASVAAFRMLCGEHGSGDVDAELDVRKNPGLKTLLVKLANDPQAQAEFAEHELRAWKKLHAQNPTIATSIATQLCVEDRVALQSWAHKLNRLPRTRNKIPDLFSKSAETPPWI